VSRYSQKGEDERRAMLGAIGVETLDELFAAIPAAFKRRELLRLPAAHAEDRLQKELGRMAAENADPERMASFLGAGFYDHYVPAAVRHLALRSEFMTAYTPYQPEVSQGTLIVIFEFQTLVAELTGMDVANASMYDGGSALAEAVLLAAGATRRPRMLLLPGVHPQHAEVVRTYATASGLRFETVPLPPAAGTTEASALAAVLGDDVAAVVVQQPNVFGLLEDVERISELTHAAGALLIASVDPVSLGILTPPGEYGADVAVAEGQSMGTAPNFGGPALGFFAAKKEHLRRMPGRLVAETVDRAGRRGYVLTLQTREQHIRRERATSNICTNTGLMATMGTMSMCLLGRRGVREVAEQCTQKAHYAARVLDRAGAPRLHAEPFFREFAVRPPGGPERALELGLERRILAGVPLRRLDPAFPDGLLVAVTERRSREEIDRLAGVMEAAKSRTGAGQTAWAEVAK
jgi:glycine dehydrogenase subunit 1